MKNIEKYVKEILEYASSTEKAIAVCKATMKPCDCSATSIRCKNCICSVDDSCENEPLYKWAMAEYVRPVNISESDRACLDYINPEWKYIARDMNGKMFAFKDKPYKCIDYWNIDDFCGVVALAIFNIKLPMVKWSDNEPWKIEDLKKLEVVNGYE